MHGDGSPEEAEAAVPILLGVGPRGELLRRRVVTDGDSAAAHDKAQHHLGERGGASSHDRALHAASAGASSSRVYRRWRTTRGALDDDAVQLGAQAWQHSVVAE